MNDFAWHWPQITWLVTTGMGLGLMLAWDGKPKTGNYSIWWSLLSTGVGALLLYYGGFFTGGAP